MRSRLMLILVVFFLFRPVASFAQFSGNLVLMPKGCEATGQCILMEPLSFKDPSGLVWEAAAQLKTDGASIPAVFQPFVGNPFDEAFIKAAIIHDHYCDRHVRSWRTTHRVFYHALIDQGVAVAKAKTMYLAVLIGGPKWIELIPSNECKLNKDNCINMLSSLTEGTGFQTRAADYSLPVLAPAMQDLYARLQVDPDALNLEQLEAHARQLKPDDFYFSHGDSLAVTNAYAIE